jgi:DNA helicase HerA-like ATPase
VNVLAADKLIASPRLYATFLLWLLSELFEELPEVGDLDKPKLVFFFDEAHLLFKDAPKPLVEKITQVVRLIRSKGVGVYLVTQNPVDVPPDVLGQLGNRVQHALRAFTPVEQRAVRAAAETFRANPKFKVETAITELAVGEALVSTLGPGGVPGVVERAMICPPRSRIGAITPEERAQTIAASPIGAKYDVPVDRESAYERLQGRATTVATDPVPAPTWGEAAAPVREDDPWGMGERAAPTGSGYVQPYSPPRRTRQPAAPSAGGLLGELLGGHGGRQGVGEAVVKSMARSFGSQVGGQVGRAILRGVLGSILKR